MKRMILLFFVMAPVLAFSQVIDYNKIILPMSAKDVSIEERLVQIAWSNHPSVTRARKQVVIAEHELRKAKGSWLNSINAAGNLNEFTIKGREAVPNNFFPRYNFSLGISLGRFISTPAEIKIARAALEAEHEDINIMKLQVRSEVLKLYSDYKTNLELLRIQREYFSDTEAQFKLVETKFKNGEATLNEYNSVRDRYDGQRMRLLNAENAYAKARYELESMIGVSVDEVL